MDFDRVETLLSIAERSMKWPHLKHLHDAAMEELEATKPQEKPKPVPTVLVSDEEKTQKEPEEKEERRV